MNAKKYRGVCYGKGMTNTVFVVFKQSSSGPEMKYILGDCLTFQWGRESRYHKDLAYAILENLFNNRIANMCCQDFADNVISRLPFSGWEIDSEEIIQRYEVEITLDALRKIK
jgi:hypothetical protein